MAEAIHAGNIEEILQQRLLDLEATVDTQEVSEVAEVGDGIAHVLGLQRAMAGELLEFTSSVTGKTVYGLAQNLDRDEVGAVLFGDVDLIKEGDECRTTGRIMDIPVGEAMLGRVVNPLGEPIDGKGSIPTTHRRPIEFKAPGIIDRTPVCEPVQTGLLSIDAMIPVGRGQRELIIGDRKTGKTAIAIDAIINQRGKGMICVYVAIGQKASTIAAIRETLAAHGALDYTVIVSASASTSAPLQYIAPMAGAAIGEYFMYNGRDGKPASASNPGGHVLAVYDDLSKQAVAYRQMSLTLRRPPGREAYPGDIFYLHSRLLERACKLSAANGGGSLTALPIIETQEGDVAAYIPTNVISITDGQIYLQSELFFQGQRPAVDVGISVSRVGGAAQTKAMKQMAGNLRLDLASYRELAGFAQFGSDLDAATTKQLTHGSRMTELLKQPRFKPMPVADQVLTLFAGNRGYIDDLELSDVVPFRDGLLAFFGGAYRKLRDQLGDAKITDELAQQLEQVVADYKEQFVATKEAEKLQAHQEFQAHEEGR
ncbi:F0F1 ATP synthase subunit alpha [Collinsella sp. zg1085]|uniref:F0F1 ATP synthase subunit alpha n=1 Tax=Collinsella sp. zg1085 TaxID=2844380 RepID=UPI001C0B77BF|nr:F0F1 ATP synthase subunit alpha [Collinsella sp. zg1085]QWT17727.1 F0F1 ATP synthase subunit alpha [Collinsella sp. zg1085]